MSRAWGEGAGAGDRSDEGKQFAVNKEWRQWLLEQELLVTPKGCVFNRAFVEPQRLCLSVSPSICLSVYLSVRLSLSLSVCLRYAPKVREL